MKTHKNQITVPISRVSWLQKKIIQPFIWIFILIMCISGCNVYVQKAEEGTIITHPSWAPEYKNLSTIRYYYFPDIECYYDIWDKEFVYLED